MSKTASHAQKATQYFKIQACGATKWSRMPGFLEYLPFSQFISHDEAKIWYNVHVMKRKTRWQMETMSAVASAKSAQ